MLTIEYLDVEEEVEIGQLFEQLNFSQNVEQTDESGDSFIQNEFDIKVLSEQGYQTIEGLRWTKLEKQVKLVCINDNNEQNILLCSPEHIIYQQNFGWIKVKDLKINDNICCVQGIFKIGSIKEYDQIERLCDLQVQNTHSYYVNNILSHNSHFLVQVGAHALTKGINVVHYTLELSETLTGKRYDSHLCNVDFNDIPENKDLILKTYEEHKDDWGRLIIKHYPANMPTIQTLRAHLERCAIKGFIPGLIIVDYADIMRSSRQYDSLRHELKLVYEELRAFADELHLPVWSASQSNKEGASSDVVDLSNMSEAYGKAMVADIVLSLSRKSQEKALGIGRLYVAKNRAGKDGILWPVKIDTAQSRITISGGQASFEEETKSSESEMKKQIRAKLDELENNSKKLKLKH